MTAVTLWWRTTCRVWGSISMYRDGEIISESGTLANPFTYTAREYDSESGLYYYRARYYDAAVGRFLSRDPLFVLFTQTFLHKNIAFPNLYPIVRNNPVNLVDPTGMIDCAYECWLWYAVMETACVTGYAVCMAACATFSGVFMWLCITACTTGAAVCHKAATDWYDGCLNDCAGGC